MRETDSPDIRIPPPVYVGMVIVVAYGLNNLWPINIGRYDGLVWFGYGVVAIGAIILNLCAWAFFKNKTDIRPHKPASSMIKAGLYRYSRNPIYLSFLLLQTGIGLVEHQVWVILTLLLSYLILRFYVISREEAYLIRQFGEAYIQYCARVRRWL